MISLHPGRRAVIASATGLSLAVAAIAGGAVATSHHTVTLEVDGVATSVSGFSKTVSDVLNSAGVEVSGYDLVAPGLDEAVSDNETIVVRTASPYSLTIDGKLVQAWSTGDSVDGVLNDVSTGGAVLLAADRSQARAELPILASAGIINVVADGQTHEVSVSAEDDANSLLGKAGVTASPIDRVMFIRVGDTIALDVTRVSRGVRTETEGIAFVTEEREDDSMTVGTTSVVQEGQDGQIVTSLWEETVGGALTVQTQLSQARTEPVTKIVAVGTKEPVVQAGATTSAAASSSASVGAVVEGDVWAALARCESGGNPSTNTGTGYYGMYQFSLPTWYAVGGSGLPSDNSAAEQTYRAQILQARSGWGQWPACARSLGLL